MSYQTFDHVATEYDAARPDYPAVLYDVLESSIAQPILRSDVLDVGAGTGIATRALAGRGAAVVAVDPGPGVLAVLRSRSGSRVRAVVGDGNALPLRSDRFDLVTYAQSWHWVDPPRALAEAARVLRGRGVLATWWNMVSATPDEGQDWHAMMHAAAVRYDRELQDVRDRDWGAAMEASGLFTWVRKVEIPWTRTTTVDGMIVDYSSHSYVAALPPADRDDLLAAMRSRLDDAFPDGDVAIPYVTKVWVARR